MPALPQIRLRSFDLDNLAQAVSRIYCPHTTHFGRARGAAPGMFAIRHAGLQSVVELRYGTPAKVDAGEFPRLVLIRTCLEGSGMTTQQGISVPMRRGETLPMSADLPTRVELDARFSQRSVKLDIDRIEAQCGRMLNRPLDRRLRFELRPFSPALESAWSAAIELLGSYAGMDMAMPAASAASLDEFLNSLVLTLHPHNFSDELQQRSRPLPPRLIREAEQLMETASGQLTVSQIAAHLRVSLRSLEAGFREHRQTTPLRHLRSIRLARVRAMLLAPESSTTVTAAALECGFVHLARFSGYYRAAFGESPAQTLRRSRTTTPASPNPLILPTLRT